MSSDPNRLIPVPHSLLKALYEMQYDTFSSTEELASFVRRETEICLAYTDEIQEDTMFQDIDAPPKKLKKPKKPGKTEE